MAKKASSAFPVACLLIGTVPQTSMAFPSAPMMMKEVSPTTEATSLQYKTAVALDNEEGPGEGDDVFLHKKKQQQQQQQPHTEDERELDKYLEYLDRRYNRLHSNDDDDGVIKPAVFSSALEWLGLKGHPNNGNSSSAQGQLEDATATAFRQQRQQEDALYVLGVAGLASEKLLQKHKIDRPHCPQRSEQRHYQQMLCQLEELKKMSTANADSHDGGVTIDVVAAPDTAGDDDVQDSKQDNYGDNNGTSLTPAMCASRTIRKRILLPFVKRHDALYRAKTIFVTKQLRRLSQTTRALLSFLFRRGPTRIVRSILEFGGGMTNIVVTYTAMSTLCILLRPLLLEQVKTGAAASSDSSISSLIALSH